MKVKKYASAELGKLSTIFFQVGLILVLAITYIGLEWEFTERNDSFSYELGNFDEQPEDIPITHLDMPPPLPPPPPPPAPEIVQIVEDDLDIKEDLIQSTESNQDAKMETIIPIFDIVVAVVEEEIAHVPFFMVEQIPLYPGCENLKLKEEQIKCMNSKINGLFGKQFDTGISEQMELKGVYKIYVVFKIDKTGDIVDIRTRGPNIRLEAEAERVARLLPKMIPGTQRGKQVSVTYTIPLVFEVRSNPNF